MVKSAAILVRFDTVPYRIVYASTHKVNTLGTRTRVKNPDKPCLLGLFRQLTHGKHGRSRRPG